MLKYSLETLVSLEILLVSSGQAIFVSAVLPWQKGFGICLGWPFFSPLFFGVKYILDKIQKKNSLHEMAQLLRLWKYQKFWLQMRNLRFLRQNCCILMFCDKKENISTQLLFVHREGLSSWLQPWRLQVGAWRNIVEPGEAPVQALLEFLQTLVE